MAMKASTPVRTPDPGPSWKWRIITGRNPIMLARLVAAKAMVWSVTPANGRRPTSPAATQPTARQAIQKPVVNISATRQVKRRNPLIDDPNFQRFFGERFNLPPETQLSLGSGVIVSREGYILTNDHVVEGVAEIHVTLADGRVTTGKVVGSDPDTDLAVVRISVTGLTPITFGQSEATRVGDVVLAIGDPFSVGQTVTMGIVSAVGREIQPANPFGSFIQTDAAINPGNSGGALVNARGELIGINTAIFSETGGYQGIGFAVPSNLARHVMDELIRYGEVQRGTISQLGLVGETPGMPTGLCTPVTP